MLRPGKVARMDITSIDSACLPILVHGVFVARQDDDGRHTADERAPALITEDIRQESTAFSEVGAVGGDGGGHGVVAAYTDTEEDAEHAEVDEAAVGTEGACTADTT